MIRGLGRQYHNSAIPHLTSRVPLPSFLQARSFLLLEEHRAEQTARLQHAHAMMAGRAPAPPPAPTPAPPTDSSAGRGRGRGKRRGRGAPGASSSSTPLPSPRPPALPGQAPGANSWTGLVQAWPMAWRTPGAGVLGPHPGTPHQQAYFAGPSAPPPPPGYGVYGPPPGFNYGFPGASSSTAPPPPGPCTRPCRPRLHRPRLLGARQTGTSTRARHPT